MNFHQLLRQRDQLLRQAWLANLAFAYQRLAEFAARIARARLRGAVTLHPGDPAANQPWPTLVAHECSQSVLEEHFLDEDVIELADILTFLQGGSSITELDFRLEDLQSRFLPKLRRELESAAVVPESGAAADQTQPEAA